MAESNRHLPESMAQWRAKAAEVAANQRNETELLVEQGYQLFFDTIGSIGLPVVPSYYERLQFHQRLFEDLETGKIRFATFDSSDERLKGDGYHYFTSDQYQLGIYNLADHTELRKDGSSLRVREAQVLVRPVNLVVGGTYYEIKYNQVENPVEGDDNPKSRRVLNINSTDYTEIVNGRLEPKGVEIPTEFDHIRLLNCLAAIYAEEMSQIRRSQILIPDPASIVLN